MGNFCAPQDSRHYKPRRLSTRRSLIDVSKIKYNFQQDYKVCKKLYLQLENMSLVSKINTNELFISQFVKDTPELSDVLIPIFKAHNLNHANITKLKHIYSVDNGFYLIYEHCKLGRMYDLYLKTKFRNEKYIKKLAYQLYSALDYLHSHDIVHGNLDLDHILSPYEDQLQVFGYLHRKLKIPEKSHKAVAPSTHFKAPELIKFPQSKPTKSADIWAAGVFLIYLLTGQSPFHDKTEALVQNRIVNASFSFSERIFEFYSFEIRLLIEAIFQIPPNDRFSAKQVLSHPWFQSEKQKYVCITRKMMKNMKRDDIDDDRLVHNSLQYMISQIYYDHERDKLSKLFVELDTDNNGSLSFQELVNGFSQQLKKEEQISYAQQIFIQSGKDFKQDISVRDFVDSLVDGRRNLSKKQLKKTFDLIDKDRNGMISLDEIELPLGRFNLSQTKISDIFNEADEDCDGQISWEEFLILMDKGHHKNSVCLDKVLNYPVSSNDPIKNCSIDLIKQMSPSYEVSSQGLDNIMSVRVIPVHNSKLNRDPPTNMTE